MDGELRQVLDAMQRDNAAAHAARSHFDILTEDLRHEVRIVVDCRGRRRIT